MKIEYANMPKGANKLSFLLRYVFNVLRTWYMFNIKYPWVKYNGFVRVMKGTSFAKRDITLGKNVQFGIYCNIATDVKIGDFVLLAGRVSIVGKNDHIYNIPGNYIWNGERGLDEMTIIEDDVWIGTGAIIIAGVRIAKGSIVAAGSVVNKDIPECEIWGGVPARKIRDRFENEIERNNHMLFLSNTKQC